MRLSHPALQEPSLLVDVLHATVLDATDGHANYLLDLRARFLFCEVWSTVDLR